MTSTVKSIDVSRAVNKFRCEICGVNFARRHHFETHEKTKKHQKNLRAIRGPVPNQENSIDLEQDNADMSQETFQDPDRHSASLKERYERDILNMKIAHQAQLDETKATYQARLDATKSAYQTQLNDMKASHQTQHDERVRAQQDHAEDVASDLRAASKKTQDLLREVSHLQHVIRSKDQHVQQLQSQLEAEKSKDQELFRVKAEAETLKDAVTTLEARVQDSECQFKACLTSYDESRALCDTMMGKVNELDRIKSENTSMSRKILDLQDKKVHLQHLTESLLGRTKRAEMRVKELEHFIRQHFRRD